MGCFEVEGSDFGGLIPLTFSIPSTVTVLPSGSFSTFCSFFPMRGRLEQEVKTKRPIVKRLNNIKIFPSRVMDAPSLIVMAILLLLYYQFFERCQDGAKRGPLEHQNQTYFGEFILKIVLIRKSLLILILFSYAVTVHPEPFDLPFALSLSKGERFTQDRPVEGCVTTPFMLRQAQHERLGNSVFSVHTIMD